MKKNKIYIPSEIWTKRWVSEFVNRNIIIQLENGDILKDIIIDEETGEVLGQIYNHPKIEYLDPYEIGLDKSKIIAYKEQTGLFIILTLNRWKHLKAH